MSIKRQAPTELTHENWDQEDSTEHEDMGTFKTAPKEVLEKRIIRTAKRRSQNLGNESMNPVFSGFGGFNKVQPSSFDFLADLTNASKPNNGTPTTKNDAAVSSSIFGNKSLSSSPSSGIFTMSGSSGFNTKPTFGKSSEGSIFGGSIASNIPQMQSNLLQLKQSNISQIGCTGSKADSTVNDSPFKLQSSPATSSTSKPNANPDVSTSQVSSSVFGVIHSSHNKSLFSATTNNTNLFTSQNVYSTSTQPSNTDTTSKAESNTAKPNSNTAKTTSKSDEKEVRKQVYYAKLKGLNVAVSDWIKKHVEETPLCFLSPIFKDYEKYLKEIQEEYAGKSTKKDEEKEQDTVVSKITPEAKSTTASNNATPLASCTLTSSNVTKSAPASNNETPLALCTLTSSNVTKSAPASNNETPVASCTLTSSNVTKSAPASNNETPLALCTLTSSNVTKSAPASNNETPLASGTLTSSNVTKLETPQSNNSTNTTKSASFNFGINTSTTTASTGFTFGIKSSTPSTASSLFSGNISTTTNANSPFSFGINKSGFGFNTTPPKSETSEEAKDEDDEPPKVEFTPVVEENSVFDIKCKIFIKKDGNFIDKGVGTLYIKKIEENGKHQLLVRANTNLGTVLLNLILSSAIPTQRMGKNNVMMVCIPTPDANPPPVPILIRVKTAEEADGLLNTLDKYKA